MHGLMVFYISIERDFEDQLPSELSQLNNDRVLDVFLLSIDVPDRRSLGEGSVGMPRRTCNARRCAALRAPNMDEDDHDDRSLN